MIECRLAQAHRLLARSAGALSLQLAARRMNRIEIAETITRIEEARGILTELENGVRL
jgi:hypothetical protein